MTKRRYSRRRGNAMVEFAVAVPMIVLIFAGTFQFGYYFYIYNRLEGAARAGARYASLRDYNSSTSTPASDFVTAVNNMVVYGSPAGGSQPVVTGLATSNVNLEVTMSNNVPSLVTVSITGFSIDAVFKSFTLTGKPKAIFRYAGRMAPAL